MADQTYQDSLGIANQLVSPLLDIAPSGADCGIEVSQRLQERGFIRDGSNARRLKYDGEKIIIIYDSLADKPFSIWLNENDADAVSEARTVTSKLIGILEDI